jgi:pimeloyl-ACP methyl ester carboxylesterase
MIPFANAYDYLKAIPRSSLAALPGLGHVPQEEAPSASIAPVIRFLNRTAPHPASP